MKAKKIDYFDGSKMTYQYEYRGYKYTIEVKEEFKNFYGIKITKAIDNFLDRNVYYIEFQSDKYIHKFNFYRGEYHNYIEVHKKTKNSDGSTGVIF